MALPIILRFIAQWGIVAARKKFGSKAIKEIIEKAPKWKTANIHKKSELREVKKQILKYFSKPIKATKKTVPKTKPVKHKTELQRVKEQIARDLKKPKTKKNDTDKKPIL